ncbi:hypothetical protein GCM10023149_11640 [Mucilaginibacter gynuensis]|uniref:HEAT repeat domain-containing protein n=1 Tax=Mucilaginibacter gynuensis TaxID=1302236 RepID=A0ABP8G137_9SPHI
MTQQELIKEISATMGKSRVVELVALLNKHRFPLTDLIDITFHTDKNIAFRASWMLENALIKDAGKYVEELNYLIAKFPEVSYPSCQRHYANIMIRLTARKASPLIKAKLDALDLEPVVEKLFDWMIDPKVLIAVKCSAAEALLHLSPRYNWIAEELANQLQFLMRNGSAAIQARGKMILKKIPPAP